MTNINWTEEVAKRKNELLEDTKGLLQIPSILNEAERKEGAPFGSEIERALLYMLKLGKESSMEVKKFRWLCWSFRDWKR